MKKEQLFDVLSRHKLWLDDLGGGEKANLRGANLSEADLRRANLCGADLSEANLSQANLCVANLSEANLSGANLSEANLSGANLSEASLRGADLRWANLRGANLSEADLSEADLNYSRGNMRELKSLNFDTWDIAFTGDVMAIGCEQHTIDEWRNFTDARIADMDDKALAWWTKWKVFIFSVIGY